MKKIAIAVLLISGIYLISCNSKTQIQKPETICDSIEMSASENLVNATLWFQKSAERRALYYQSYNYAKIAIDNQLKNHKGKNKNAVVLDIDETVLDNSPYQGMLIKQSLSFTSQTWKEWTNLAIAKALPGAVDFTNYAKSKGIDVFYVSNRDDDEKNATIRNLINEKFPFADENHVFCRINKESSKTSRYDSISKTHQILLIVGDNLRDFDELFGNRSKNYGFDALDSMYNQLGEKFILLPNPMYGDWEKAIYGRKYPNEIERNKLRKQALQSF
jgi:5'-nucleotidase (lipoprotein e(P4) family)